VLELSVAFPEKLTFRTREFAWAFAAGGQVMAAYSNRQNIADEDLIVTGPDLASHEADETAQHVETSVLVIYEFLTFPTGDSFL
jgi:hypothetical protein